MTTTMSEKRMEKSFGVTGHDFSFSLICYFHRIATLPKAGLSD